MTTPSRRPFAATADKPVMAFDPRAAVAGADPISASDEDATRVYLAIIRLARPTRDLLLAQGLPPHRLDPALKALTLRGLLTVGPDGVIHVPSPSSTMPLHALELERRAAQARAAADNLAKIYYAARSQGPGSLPGIQILPDLDAVRTVTNEAVALSSERIRSLRGLTARTRQLLDAPLDTHRSLTVGVGGRALRMDTIWDAAVLEIPGVLPALAARRASGEGQRSIALTPFTIIVFDDDACLVEWTGDEEGPQGLLGRTRGAVAAGAAMFERLWQLATPVRDGPPSDGGGDLDERDTTFLRLMAAGVSDAAIARQTGFSQRTVERRIRHVMDRLGAQTRFQAGVQAVHRGWL